MAYVEAAKKKQKNKKNKKQRSLSLSELKTLGNQLLTSRAHVNNLTVLLSYISETSPPQHALESILSLQAFFTPLLAELPSSASASASASANANNDDPEFIYKIWLRSKFDDFLQSLINIAISSHSDEALREVVLDTLMEFVKVGGKGGIFHSSIYHNLLLSIVHSTLVLGDIILQLLASKYFNYIDVRYFTYTSLDKLSRTLDDKNVSDDQSTTPNANCENLSRESMELSVHKIYHLLSNIPPLEGGNVKSDYEMWNGLGIFIKKGNHNDIGSSKAEDKARKTGKSDEKVLSAADISKKMKLKFTKAWISFLRLPLPVDVYKEVLVSLHQDVIPRLSNPIMLCDFLTRSYDIGGVVSVMALSSLFVLMTQHGLEYPNFYEKLYALLEPSIFMAKHRAKFFELLDSCLKSPLLPAYLAAAFSKKLSRLALHVPPSGALIIIALIHNLLRRHPSINCLVQREDGETAKDVSESKNDHSAENKTASRNMSSDRPGIDHFDNEQTDPVNTNSMRSSLWEIDTLRHHYCPPVSRFVLSLENDLTVRAKTTEVAVKDFSSGSYATIFNDEIRRRVKQVPLAFYKSTPTTLFTESDFPGWTFSFKDEESISSKDEKSDTRVSEEQNGPSAKRQRMECS